MLALPNPLPDLEARGLLQDSTDRVALARRLTEGATSVYYGCDPTAPSLHTGNLIGLLVLRHFQLAGHRPIALAGGATGMIGDPSGRSAERNLLDEDTLATNLVAIKEQMARVVDFGEGPSSAILVDNGAWTREISFLTFLRDVGKHVTVNQMLAKESVRARLHQGEGLSFTEFSYMLLQAHDYLWLHEHEGCELQIGGSDQWGNITAGIDLIRRRTGRHVHGLTWPLIIRSDGRKFAKSEVGAIWLSAERTSPYRFFQYWMQVPDADVPRFLLQFTMLPVSEATAIAADHAAAPERREGQRRLAREVTTLVHGRTEAKAAEAASLILFGAELDDLPAQGFATLAGEIDTSSLDASRLAEGIELGDIMAEVGLATSKGDARRALAQGGVYLNNQRVRAEGRLLTEADLRGGAFILVRRGKRQYHLLRRS